MRSLVPAKSNSYYQAFNFKSLFGEIDGPKKSQVELEGQIKPFNLVPTSSHATAGTTAATVAFPAAAAVVVGCGWRIGYYNRGEAHKTPRNLRILRDVRHQTTIVVAVERWYSHHSRIMRCRAVAAQPLGEPRYAQLLDATAVVAAEPNMATIAAPWWCRACSEISSGSTTTHFNISLSEYDSFIFDLTHEEFVDELAHIISPPEYDRFYFWNLPDPGELMYVLNFGIRENLSTNLVNLPIEDDYSPLLAYVVWIFVAYLTLLPKDFILQVLISSASIGNHVRMTLEGKKTWLVKLGAGVYDSWNLQGDVEELWDELAKLGLGLRCCLVSMVPRLNFVPKEVMWPLGSQVESLRCLCTI
nr:hypothetical protein [Tanacetum cinerariifolium]